MRLLLQALHRALPASSGRRANPQFPHCPEQAEPPEGKPHLPVTNPIRLMLPLGQEKKHSQPASPDPDNLGKRMGVPATQQTPTSLTRVLAAPAPLFLLPFGRPRGLLGVGTSLGSFCKDRGTVAGQGHSHHLKLQTILPTPPQRRTHGRMMGVTPCTLTPQLSRTSSKDLD